MLPSPGPKPILFASYRRDLQIRRRPPINSDHKLVSTFQILTFGALGMAIVLALLPAAGHDQLWFLLMAQRWLHGAALYGPQAFDSNTPAIVWLSALPVALAEHLHLPLPFTAKLLMTLLEAAIAALSLKICTRLSLITAPLARWLLVFAFIALFAVAPARDFGQRDLIAALLCLPYLLAAAQPLSSLRLFTALLAAAAACVKPQLALIPFAVELTAPFLSRTNLPHTNLPRKKFRHSERSEEPLYLPLDHQPSSPSNQKRPSRLRPEPLLFLAAAALFLLAIHLFAPLYLTSALPTTLHTYWAIGHLTPTQLFAASIQLHLLLATVLLLLPLTLRTQSAIRATLRLLTVAGIAATLAYYQQSTGWYYQQLPGITLLGIALAFELLILAQYRPFRTPNWLPRAAAALSLLAVALTLHFSNYPFTDQRAYAITSPDPTFFAGLPPGTAVATLTTSVDDAIEPLFRYHLAWAQRTDNLWTLPAILRATTPTPAIHPPRRLTPAVLAELTAQQRRWMVEDLTRWHPQLILVARCQSSKVHCQELEDRHDNLLAFFLADPAFRAIWQHYRPLRTSGDYDAYILAN